MTEKYELSRRKALAALGTIGVAGAGAGLGTSALFSDTESFTNNVITAGTTNLRVTLGLVEVRSTATAEDLGISLDAGDDPATADGEVRTGVQVGDMKPGDCIVLRATVDVEDNPMFVGVTVDNIIESGGVTTEPEPTPDNGELSEYLEVTFGYDDDRNDLHNSTLEGNITADPGGQIGSGVENVTNGTSYLYRGRNNATFAPPGGHGDGSASPTRIGDVSMTLTDRDKVTHFIEICLPESVGNEVQGDSIEFDLVWSAEQVRNNPDPANVSQLDGDAN